MPKILRVRAPQDEKEERWVRKWAGSRHGPADWIAHARMVTKSWDGERVEAIAQEPQCSPQTVRRRLHRFDALGIEGLGDRPKPGRPRRLTTEDDSKLIALARQAPPGRLVTQRDATMVARGRGRSPMELECPGTSGSRGRNPGQTQPGPSHSLTRKATLAEHAQVERTARQRLCPKRTAVVTHYTAPAEGSTTICTDELGPVVPRTFDPAPGWSTDGHRIKAPRDDGRGPAKTWVYGALRVCDGKEITRCAASRNSKGYIELLKDIEADNPGGDVYIITDNLSSHNSLETRTWLEGHPRLHQVFIPTGACWLNLQEGWWRLFRRDALAGQSEASPKEIEQATRVATAQLNRRANPWIWGRPPKARRHYRHVFCYRI